MHGPDGTDYPNRITFAEISRPGRIAYAHDADKEDDPERFHVTVAFDDLGGRTKLSMRLLFPTAAQRDKVVGLGALRLGSSTLEKLAEHLEGIRTIGETSFVATPGKPTIVMRRAFAVRRRFVFEAWTRQEHVASWWGPRGSRLTVCEIDLRAAGSWRLVLRTVDGRERGFGGVFREVLPPERLIYTIRYDGAPGADALQTLTLTEGDRRTMLLTTSVHPSVGHRDHHIRVGMEVGTAEAMDRLADYLRTIS